MTTASHIHILTSFHLDIYSLALTAVSSLFRKYNIDPKSIGRLEVGTETLLDKSKSVKSVLMQLFEESGNSNIEGVDTVNACYGGTNAIFNAVNWVESSAWDGRDAVVVAGDIAIYQKGNARPTGGAGCVAMLIGPDAPVVFEPGLRGSYMAHTYDFYKPDLTSEYPYVDGHYSIKCYTEAVDNCYRNYLERVSKKESSATSTPQSPSPSDLPVDRFDYMCFHAPTCKLVAKSYARLMYNDYKADPSNPAFADVSDEVKNVSYDASLTDRVVEKTFMKLSQDRFKNRVAPSITVPTMCGNMYAASVYSSLASILGTVPSGKLDGKRIGIFSFGSGLASSLFSVRIPTGSSSQVDAISKNLDVENRLASREVVTPEVYDQMCLLREKAHLKKSFQPAGSPDGLFPGTYYLTDIDDMFRRKYAVKSD